MIAGRLENPKAAAPGAPGGATGVPHGQDARATGAPAGARRALKNGLADLPPAYFALAMATGIVSLACDLLGLPQLAHPLFLLNLAAYAVLWAATLARAVLCREQFLQDWASHQRGPGFFTTVAATCVVGVQVVVLGNHPGAALLLWWFGLALWAVCTYAIFVSLSIREDKPTLAEGINGGWLVAVVATQSVCVLGCILGPERIGGGEASLFVLMSLWLCGGMLYIWMISLIFYRYMFFRFAPSDLMPPYWINMGAVAISTLAGTRLIAATPASSSLFALLPFVKGFTLMYWATATWWIPMLVVLGIWRHYVRGFRFAYNPLYWGLVFPLGMYSVCTFQLGQVFEVPFLSWIARVFVVLALVAWTLTFFGLAGRFLYVLVRALRTLPSVRSPAAGPLVESPPS